MVLEKQNGRLRGNEGATASTENKYRKKAQSEDSSAMTCRLINAVKEQRDQIKKLEARIEEPEKRNNSIKSVGIEALKRKKATITGGLL